MKQPPPEAKASVMLYGSDASHTWVFHGDSLKSHTTTASASEVSKTTRAIDVNVIHWNKPTTESIELSEEEAKAKAEALEGLPEEIKQDIAEHLGGENWNEVKDNLPIREVRVVEQAIDQEIDPRPRLNIYKQAQYLMLRLDTARISSQTAGKVSVYHGEKLVYADDVQLTMNSVRAPISLIRLQKSIGLWCVRLNFENGESVYTAFLVDERGILLPKPSAEH